MGEPKEQDKAEFYDELLKYIKELETKQDVVNSVNLKRVSRMLEMIKPHFCKASNKK